MTRPSRGSRRACAATCSGPPTRATTPPARIHNGMIDRRPALIARCAGVADVVAAVRFAREQQLLVSVRGGGHSVPGLRVCDGGLMIDLSRMQGVRVDPARRTARAEGGVTWGEFDHETQAFGLATTGGVARPTGIAGLTLGGGHGLLMRRYGLACDNLLSVDVVTADGPPADGQRGRARRPLLGAARRRRQLRRRHLVRVPAPSGRPASWAACCSTRWRGPRRSSASTATWPARPRTSWARLAALATLPDGTQAAAVLVCYSGPIADGERLLAPAARGRPAAGRPGRADALHRAAEHRRELQPAGHAQLLEVGLPDAAERRRRSTCWWRRYPAVPAPHTHVVIEHMGGAVSRVGEDATAVSHRDAPYNARRHRDVGRPGPGRAGHRLGARAVGGAPAVLAPAASTSTT